MEQSFYEQVFEIARLIPKGRVTSYGAIAKALGAAKSARLVGYAMNFSHTASPKVPAHRVVNSSGLLTGKFHFSPPELMEQLLAQEGIIVIGDQIKDFKKVFWNPLEEIS